MSERAISSFPSIPASNWWALRARFKASPPKSAVDAAYLSPVLGISMASANNLIGPLQRCGLIDSYKQITELANRWRDDQEYPRVCEEMIEAVYPDGLRDLSPIDAPDRVAASRWISQHAGVGSGASEKMTSFYLLLCARTPAESGQPKSNGQNKTVTPQKPRGIKGSAASKVVGASKSAASSNGVEHSETIAPPSRNSKLDELHAALPGLHIDLQIHISPDSSPEQIESIFSNMAKYLYGRTNG